VTLPKIFERDGGGDEQHPAGILGAAIQYHPRRVRVMQVPGQAPQRVEAQRASAEILEGSVKSHYPTIKVP
jgi:hypothetical protein